MPGPRQPGQAEEQLGDEEPGPVAPSDACTPTSVSCIKVFLARKKSDRKFHICLRQIYRSFFFLWIFYHVWKHQSCGMKCSNFRAFNVLNKMNLKLFRLFLFTFK